jgi:ribosome-associated protein
MRPLFVSSSISVPPDELSWTSVRASGPGGQNVNKVASKVELRFDLPRSRVLPEEMKSRLASLASGRLDADGRIVIVSQKTRDRERNLEDALEKLRELLAAAAIRPKRRRATMPTKSSQRRRVADKRAQSEKKRDRGRRADAE